ncbi:MAG: ribosome maturation factor RimM [Alphaproteobacteria bacterium]|jgi:16S rRNA processing protein RimM
MQDQNKILVGEIVGAQGLRGEVRVKTYTQKPTDFSELKIESAKFNQEAFKFIRAIPKSVVIIAKIDGVNNRTQADALRGTKLFIDRDTLPVLSDGEFYHADLIGMTVNQNTVIAVHNFGAGDILELDNGEMVSFSGAKVDINKKIISL